MQTTTTIPLLTEQGKKNLGELLKYCRIRKKWSLDEMRQEIELLTGHPVSKSALSFLERGLTDPKWNTLSILASSGIYINPQTGRAFTPTELFEVACEMIKINFEITLEITHPCD